MTEILEIAKDFAEDLAPHVISRLAQSKHLRLSKYLRFIISLLIFGCEMKKPVLMWSCQLVWWRV